MTATTEVVHPKTGKIIHLLPDLVAGGLWTGVWTEADYQWIKAHLHPEPLFTLAQEICYTP